MFEKIISKQIITNLYFKKDVPLDTSVIDFSKVFKELKRQHFNGNIIIESNVGDEGKGNNLISVKKFNSELS